MKTRRERYQSPPPPKIVKTVKVKRRESENIEKNDIKKDLNEIYKNIKSAPSYSKKITQFLQQTPSSSLFRQVRHKYPRRRIRAFFPYHIMMSDTINYRSYGLSNHNWKYCMVMVDVFSKRAYAQPMKRMRDFDATIAMENMLKMLPDLPKIIITDLGTEYYNSKMRALFQRFGIKHYSIRGKHKACVAERFIRTIKSRLERYFWEKKTHNWVDVLQDFIENYNNTYHRSIKMSPNAVNENNRKIVFANLFPHIKDKTPPRLQRGDKVRLLKRKNLFDKGYSRSWSTAIYEIKTALSDAGVDYYEISDLQGNVLPRKKYYWELNLVIKNDN